MFQKVILMCVLCALANEKLFVGRFSLSEKMLYNLLEMVMYSGIDVDDMLVFTHWRAGQFDIVVYNNSRIEKPIQEVGTETEGNDYNEPLIVPDGDIHEEALDNYLVVIPREFTVVMSKSNVKKSSHGVYIPRHIIPRDREWSPNEKVALRTENEEWTVGLAFSIGLPRCSAGWNKLSKDNELIYRQTLFFTLLDDEENGVVFEIELH